MNLTSDAHPVSRNEWLEPYIFSPNTPSWLQKEQVHIFFSFPVNQMSPSVLRTILLKGVVILENENQYLCLLYFALVL